jgi:hypothetical protein
MAWYHEGNYTLIRPFLFSPKARQDKRGPTSLAFLFPFLSNFIPNPQKSMPHFITCSRLGLSRPTMGSFPCQLTNILPTILTPMFNGKLEFEVKSKVVFDTCGVTVGVGVATFSSLILFNCLVTPPATPEMMAQITIMRANLFVYISFRIILPRWLELRMLGVTYWIMHVFVRSSIRLLFFLAFLNRVDLF